MAYQKEHCSERMTLDELLVEYWAVNLAVLMVVNWVVLKDVKSVDLKAVSMVELMVES
jgi:hypothetical protein